MPSELFHFLEPARDIADLGPWESLAHGFTCVSAYSSFGDFILVNPRTGEHAILLTMTAEIEPTGFNSASEFRTVFLSDLDVVEPMGKPALLAELEKRLGPLNLDEVFFPVPYPFLGGSGRPETFDKGNVWTFAQMVGQSHGIGVRPTE